jgi:hypothetical protein
MLKMARSKMTLATIALQPFAQLLGILHKVHKTRCNRHQHLLLDWTAARSLPTALYIQQLSLKEVARMAWSTDLQAEELPAEALPEALAALPVLTARRISEIYCLPSALKMMQKVVRVSVEHHIRNRCALKEVYIMIRGRWGSNCFWIPLTFLIISK